MAAGKADPAGETAKFRARVYWLVAMIPPGRVATYGQIAALASHPRRARHVGNALAQFHDAGLPWHRVINAQGRISPRAGAQRTPGERVEHRQERLLRGEGVVFSDGQVDLERYRWRPEIDGALLRGMPRGH